MRVSKSDGNGFSFLNEMNEKMSFKMLCKICCFIYQSLIYCDLTKMGCMDFCLSLRIDNRILKDRQQDIIMLVLLWSQYNDN